MYIRKTKDVYHIEIDYGYGEGFESVYCTEDIEEAHRVKKDYINNDTYAKAIRIKLQREKI